MVQARAMRGWERNGRLRFGRAPVWTVADRPKPSTATETGLFEACSASYTPITNKLPVFNSEMLKKRHLVLALFVKYISLYYCMGSAPTTVSSVFFNPRHVMFCVQAMCRYVKHTAR